MTYTHTRITTDYLAKLQALAVANRRSATKQLEALIDEAERQTSSKPHGKSKIPSGGREGVGHPATSSMPRSGKRHRQEAL